MKQAETKRPRDQETKWKSPLPRTPSLRLPVSPSLPRAGFSLVELLVVIGLVVVILALAMPAFNFITGSRSVDGATNLVSAFLGRARAEALDRGKVTGVLFYIDPATERRGMTLVTETNAKYTSAGAEVDNPNIDVYLDLLPDREPILLQTGIDVQVVDNGSKNAANSALTAPYWDRYLGFNSAVIRATDPPSGQLNAIIRCGGVILFDRAGKLVSLKYAFRCSNGDVLASTELTQLGLFLTGADPAAASATPDVMPKPSAANDPDTFIRSQLGLVLFEQELFDNAGWSLADYEIAKPAVTVQGESAEEAWLDENATPLLINRYNGTLVRGQ
jgi:prepilin-type N-terminal cleavage/methylation domain-containing protein